MAAPGLRPGGRWNTCASTLARKRRALERSLDAILAAPTSCDLARDIQSKVRRARDQLLTFAHWPGMVEATNNACERALRPAVIQRKVTNGYRSMSGRRGAKRHCARSLTRLVSSGTPIRFATQSFRLCPPEPQCEIGAWVITTTLLHGSRGIVGTFTPKQRAIASLNFKLELTEVHKRCKRPISQLVLNATL